MNKSEELAKLLGIEPYYTVIINIGDLDMNFQKFAYKSKFTLLRNHFHELTKDPEDCSMYGTYIGDIKQEYPDFTKPANFIMLLEILNNAELIVQFFKSQLLNIGFCCEIEDSYMHENMPDFAELFCEHSVDNPQLALINTLINIYNRKWVCIMSDPHFFKEFEETIGQVQQQAQQADWGY